LRGIGYSSAKNASRTTTVPCDAFEWLRWEAHEPGTSRLSRHDAQNDFSRQRGGFPAPLGRRPGTVTSHRCNTPVPKNSSYCSLLRFNTFTFVRRHFKNSTMYYPWANMKEWEKRILLGGNDSLFWLEKFTKQKI
jgi:hypothetical protein